MATIALVEPEPPGYHVYSAFSMPRMGLPSLGAVLKQQGHDVTIYCQSIEAARVEDLLAADIVGISTTTSTAPEAYRLADLCRAAGKPVILGGVHVTFCTDEALQHADYVVRGEAEGVIGPLVERIEAHAPVEDLPGVFTEPGQAPAAVPTQCRVQDLDALPFPDLSLIKGWRNDGPVTPMLTSRGCPYDCKFCSVAPMFGRHYRFRNTDSVLAELALLKPRGVLFFYDDNFAASRRRTVELLEGMLSRGLKVKWAAQVRADVTRDRELMQLFRRSGCHRVYVGYESVSAATLDEYDKGETVEEIVASVRIFHEHGIKTHGMFVLGSDSDSIQTIRETSRFARRHHINSVQFMVLTPLPGTRTSQELDAAGRIFERDWRLYDGQHVVFNPSRMSAAQLQREAWRAQERFYSLCECLKSFASLHLEDGAIKTYAWNLMRRCKADIRDFVERLRCREASPNLGSL
ncbi:MAG: B12-binding domain-containing radical SAM protein [Armatimonadetes bacterium]|nr:B12-binding domain-containing radical SAM protein [Armatimonadota bacterium]